MVSLVLTVSSRLGICNETLLKQIRILNRDLVKCALGLVTSNRL